MIPSEAVKITPLNKTLSALAILLFFTFGAVAVSLAYDAPSVTPAYALQLRHVATNGPAPLDRYTLRIGLDSETSDISPASLAYLTECRLARARILAPMGASPKVQVHVPKASLQIFESVLLL